MQYKCKRITDIRFTVHCAILITFKISLENLWVGVTFWLGWSTAH